MAEQKDIELAADIKQALQAAGFWEEFAKMAASHKREYVKWIEEAKKPETRERRIQKMCEMLAEGRKNWNETDFITNSRGCFGSISLHAPDLFKNSEYM